VPLAGLAIHARAWPVEVEEISCGGTNQQPPTRRHLACAIG
jgi:hypothetical protein